MFCNFKYIAFYKNIAFYTRKEVLVSKEYTETKMKDHCVLKYTLRFIKYSFKQTKNINKQPKQAFSKYVAIMKDQISYR